MISFFQAIILGLVQGAAELFPVSGLGHSVLVANLLNWHDVLKQQHSGSPTGFVALLALIQLATALALLIFYRQQWLRLLRGFVRSLRTKQLAADADASLAWLLIAAAVPAIIITLLLEHTLRQQFAKPFLVIIFILLNGLLLLKGDKLLSRLEKQRPRRRRLDAESELAASRTSRSVSGKLTFARAALIGTVQSGALLSGLSRTGITMVIGLRSGLEHQAAARFSFLLATPVLLVVGLANLPDFFGSAGDGLRGQLLLGGIAAGISAYYCARYLDRYFQNHNLRIFGRYCLGLGACMLLLGIYRGHF